MEKILADLSNYYLKVAGFPESSESRGLKIEAPQRTRLGRGRDLSSDNKEGAIIKTIRRCLVKCMAFGKKNKMG